MNCAILTLLMASTCFAGPIPTPRDPAVRIPTPRDRGAGCPCGCKQSGVCDCADCPLRASHKDSKAPVKYYARASAEAIASGSPLVTFVGCPPCPCPDGMIVCQCEALQGYPKGCAVISVIENGRHYHFTTIIDPRPERIVRPKRTFAGCSSGVCVPTYFPEYDAPESGTCRNGSRGFGTPSGCPSCR
jgi:hypothetical protein